MRGSAWLIAGLALGGVLSSTTAARAQAAPSAPGEASTALAAREAGPTRLYAVPRADVLGLGTNLVSAGLSVGGIGLGPAPVGIGVSSLSGKALNLRSEMGWSPNFELGSGLAVTGTTPWHGKLDVSGKWALMQEGTSIASVAGLVGGLLEIDANGTPSLGMSVGLPISKVFPFGNAQTIGVSLVPSWNLGLANLPGSLVGAAAGPFNFFGLGLGADLGLLPNLHLLADTNLGFPVAGLSTQSALGLRYAFSPDWVGDLFIGTHSGTQLGTTGGPASLGLGTTWRY